MNNQQNVSTEIREESIQILKTVLLLDRAYSLDYVQRIVSGDERFPLRNLSHKELETFGMLEGVFFSRINGIIEYLVQHKYLEVKEAQYGTLLITDLGQAYLDAPESLRVPIREIRQAWYQYELTQSLRKLRKDIAEQSDWEPYKVFNNFSLRQIVKHLPETMVELAQLPGMDELDEPSRLLILAEISRIMEKKAIDEETGIFSRSYRPSHKKIKELYEAGMAPEEIAKRRKLKLSTIVEYMSTMHQAGMLDMKPYIEETVDSKVLHKASKYFQEAQNAQLKEAHEVLGLDYETLQKCKTYVAQVHEPQMAYVAQAEA